MDRMWIHYVLRLKMTGKVLLIELYFLFFPDRLYKTAFAIKMILLVLTSHGQDVDTLFSMPKNDRKSAFY